MITDPGRRRDTVFGDIITAAAMAVAAGPARRRGTPDIAGGIADPTAIMSVALLLSHLGEHDAAAGWTESKAHLATRAMPVALVSSRVGAAEQRPRDQASMPLPNSGVAAAISRCVVLWIAPALQCGRQRQVIAVAGPLSKCLRMASAGQPSYLRPRYLTAAGEATSCGGADQAVGCVWSTAMTATGLAPTALWSWGLRDRPAMVVDQPASMNVTATSAASSTAPTPCIADQLCSEASSRIFAVIPRHAGHR